MPTNEADIRRKLDWDLTTLITVMREGREARAWELLREARALAYRLPRGTASGQREKIKKIEIVLRSPSWRSQAAAARHKRPELPHVER